MEREVLKVAIDAAMDGVIDNMRERTGRSLEEWVALVEQTGPDPLDQKAVRTWLRDEHGVLQNSQWAIAMEAASRAGWTLPTADQYLDTHFAGPKAHLRPIYDAVAPAILDLGDDVTIEGRASYTTFVRGRQFALVAASTKARVDLGLRFRTEPDHPRLVAARNLGQCTHRVPLASPEEFTDDLLPLLRQAYEENG